jgi:putative ABC transport system substrate-binding protein
MIAVTGIVHQRAGAAMDRRRFSIGVAATFATSPLTCFGQGQSKLWRIGMLETTAATLNTNLGAFRQRLSELGYAEGRNLVVEYRSSDGRDERFASLAKEMVASKVDLIVVRGTPATMAVRAASDSIPVVVAATGDALLFASSLAHPGGNITGVSSVTVDLEAKRLGLLRELLPGMSRVAFLSNLGNPVVPREWKELLAAANALGMQAEMLDARKPEDLEAAFAAASRQHVEGISVGIDGIFQANRRRVVELAAQHRIPTMYRSTEFIEVGGLITYGPIYAELYRQTADLVAKIFAGAKPGDLPIQEPARFELVINAGAAKALGLPIPQSLLLQADRVVE